MPTLTKRSRLAEYRTLYLTAREQVRELEAELRQQREHAAACEREAERCRDELARLTAGPWQHGQEHWLNRVLAIGGQLEHLSLDCQACDRSEHEGCPVCREVAATGLGLSAMARVWVEGFHAH